MSLKVWVKRSGVGDEEALGLRVPADGTAHSVVEACRGVFRNLQPSPMALRTEEGIIIALASPVAALQSHTLELIEMPQAEAPKKRATRPVVTATAAPAVAAVSRVKSEPLIRQHLPQRRTARAALQSTAAINTAFSARKGAPAPPQKTKGVCTASEAAKSTSTVDNFTVLWDGLPAFTPHPPCRNIPSVAGVLQLARCAYMASLGPAAAVDGALACDAGEGHPPGGDAATSSRNDGTPELPGSVNNSNNNDSRSHTSDTGDDVICEECENEGIKQSHGEHGVMSLGELGALEGVKEEVSAFRTASELPYETTAAIATPLVFTKEAEVEALARDETASVERVTLEADCRADVNEDLNHSILHNNVRESEETRDDAVVGAAVNDLPDNGEAYFDEW
ncbi:hypothetical protein DQ04_00311120 [Trypanosoma grayi]|uniref:hypothetical protein n=1 Tax=Trypanosoma grayi TaxID=71804 RepID=UPI0004F3F60E|nr:hypothetical protein DQ04_00311120 [Trypanosoma grayi]KEG14776.1 hypothetical protein DQ04_00311120 [Trypanosoma grayi]